jgi:opacity protein-like surface antigen
MKLLKTIIATSAATALLAGAAAAQDAKPFEGMYAGAEAGVDWTRMSDTEKRDRSIYYGGVLGYRVQSDSNMVIGVEGTFGDTGYNQQDARNTDYEYSGSLILGQAFGANNNNLVYGKAGYVRSRFDLTDSADGGAFTEGGWRFGGGYEHALSNGLSLRTGLDYTTYGDGITQWTGKAGLLARF